MGEYQSAISNFTKSVELLPSDARTYDRRGRSYSELSQYNAAIQDYARAYDLDKDYGGYDDVIFKTSGTASRADNLSFKFIDKAGNSVLLAPCPQLDQRIAEGLTPFDVGVRTGYVDKSGTVVIKPVFDDAAPFSDGLAAVRLGDEVGYIEQSGKFVIWPKFAAGCDFHDGLAVVLSGKRPGFDKHPDFLEYAMVDKSGNLSKPIILSDKVKALLRQSWGLHFNPENIDEALGYSEGLAPIQVGSKYGFMDGSGRVTIAAKFDDVDQFSEGLAAAFDGRQWGYVDMTGEFVIKPQWDKANKFQNGIARVGVLKAKSEDPVNSPCPSKSAKIGPFLRRVR